MVTPPPEAPSSQGRRPVEPDLADLARAHGVAVEYWDQAGRYRAVSAETVLAVLAALGVDGSTPESRWLAWEQLRERPWRRMLPPVFVARQGRPARTWVHVEHGAPVVAWVDLEGGGRRDLVQLDHWVEPREIDGRLVGEAAFEIPADLPLGWHTLYAASYGVEGSCPLVMTPDRLSLPDGMAGRQTWGLMAQLYSLRSRRSWGLGDLVDLAELARWSATAGAGFVLVNPLHAASPAPPMTPSPYLPATRRFANPVYLRPEAVPEYADLSAADRARVDLLAGDCRAMNATADLLDRDRVWAAKREALALIHAVPLRPDRRAEYVAYVEREDPGLTDFASWTAFAEEWGGDPADWPEDVRDAVPQRVAAERERLAGRVDFHRWLQWQCDSQLAGAQRVAREAGMPAGIVHDLAVGVHPEGSDAWALRDVLAAGVSVGAPPDMYNQVGQDWSQPPWRPDALADAAFVPYRDMLRTLLRHAGGIRIDHVLGLFRLWWVPKGMPPNEGTYVAYDHEALVGILCLEAHRAGAFVVGEDLGTVEAWVQDLLADRGVLGTSILWFEMTEDGRPRPPQDWRPLCLASVTVHDLPPTAGYLAGEHVRVRDRLGLLTRPVDEEWAAHEQEVALWTDALRAEGLVGSSPDEVVPEEDLVAALHRYVARSPSALVGVAVPDLVGDHRPQNQPGTDQEYPNWRVPQCDGEGRPVLLEDLESGPVAARAAALIAAVSGSRP